jgi:hypothetical protein
MFLGPDTAHADVSVLWYASRSASAKINWLWGDAECDGSEGDCNPCLPDVEGQFRAALNEGGMQWTGKPWHFDWDARYAPSEMKARHPFDVENAAIQSQGHVQGFVRTGVDQYPFAITHSDDSTGAVAIIVQDADGRKSLKALHRTTSSHPGSLSTIGKYVALADAHELRAVDVSRPTASQDIHYPMPGAMQIDSDFNGGTSVAKLRGGGHLVVFVNGGSNADNRKTAFVFLDGPLERPNRLEYLGDFPLKQTLSASASSIRTWEGAQLPENTSLLTECDTGRLYTVHFGSGTSSLEGTAAIHLAKLDWGSSGPMTSTVALYGKEQDSDNCWFRGGASAGSALGDPDTLRIFCHERSRHLSNGGGDIFRFVEGVNEF